MRTTPAKSTTRLKKKTSAPFNIPTNVITEKSKHPIYVSICIVNCSQNYISQIELEITLPRADVLVAIANYFGVSVDYLLYRTEYKHNIEINTPHETKQAVEYAKKLINLSLEKRQAIDNIIDILLEQNE